MPCAGLEGRGLRIRDRERDLVIAVIGEDCTQSSYATLASIVGIMGIRGAFGSWRGPRSQHSDVLITLSFLTLRVRLSLNVLADSTLVVMRQRPDCVCTASARTFSVPSLADSICDHKSVNQTSSANGDHGGDHRAVGAALTCSAERVEPSASLSSIIRAPTRRFHRVAVAVLLSRAAPARRRLRNTASSLHARV